MAAVFTIRTEREDAFIRLGYYWKRKIQRVGSRICCVNLSKYFSLQVYQSIHDQDDRQAPGFVS